MQAQKQASDFDLSERLADLPVIGPTATLPWRQRQCPWCGSERAECSTSSRYPTVAWVCAVCSLFEVAWGTVAWLDERAELDPERWTAVRREMSARVRASHKSHVITPEVLMQVAEGLSVR